MKRKFFSAAMLAAALFVASPHARAGTFTWTGTDGPLWSDANNWGGTGPASVDTNDTLNFNSGPTQVITTNSNGSANWLAGVGQINFGAGAPAYTINAFSNSTGLAVNLGITNNSTNTQTFSEDLTIPDAGAATFSAASGNLVYGNVNIQGDGAALTLGAGADTGTHTFANISSNGTGASTVFNDTGNATNVVVGGVSGNNSTGSITFDDTQNTSGGGFTIQGSVHNYTGTIAVNTNSGATNINASDAFNNLNITYETNGYTLGGTYASEFNSGTTLTLQSPAGQDESRLSGNIVLGILILTNGANFEPEGHTVTVDHFEIQGGHCRINDSGTLISDGGPNSEVVVPSGFGGNPILNETMIFTGNWVLGVNINASFYNTNATAQSFTGGLNIHGATYAIASLTGAQTIQVGTSSTDTTATLSSGTSSTTGVVTGANYTTVTGQTYAGWGKITTGGASAVTTNAFELVSGATLAPGKVNTASGVLTVIGGLTVDTGSTLSNFLGATPTASETNVSGLLTLASSGINLALSNATPGTYDILSTSGTYSGPTGDITSAFSITGVPAGDTADVTESGGVVAVTIAVPEPASLSLLGFGGLLLLRRRRAAKA